MPQNPKMFKCFFEAENFFNFKELGISDIWIWVLNLHMLEEQLF
jgi:hypothetical protein